MSYTAQSPDGTGRWISVTLESTGCSAFLDLCQSLAADLRFEYLGEREREDAAWEFVASAADQRRANHISAFVDRYSHEPLRGSCSFIVEHLVVDRARQMFGARFVPADEAPIPPQLVDQASSTNSVVEVSCAGTNGQRMLERATRSAEHALRLLRAGLRDHIALRNEQLRFRLGTSYWFAIDGQAQSGWRRRPDEPLSLTLNDEHAQLATAPAIAALPENGKTDIECRANCALTWWERSFFSTDPIVKVVFLLAALEAILGEKSEPIKGPDLALQRAALSQSLGEGFVHPGRASYLYEHVRSMAVHGEEPKPLSLDDAETFEWDVRKAISEYLRYAGGNELIRRKRVRESLADMTGKIEGFLASELSEA
jgi:hypothetical protein